MKPLILIVYLFLHSTLLSTIREIEININSHPCYHADGDHILFSASISKINTIIVLNKKTGIMRELALGFDASYTLDGKSIVFASSKPSDNFSEIWIMDNDEKNKRKVAPSTNQFRRMPVLTPDNKRLFYYNVYKDGASGVFGVDIDGQNMVDYKTGTLGVGNITCSKDGKYLFFSSLFVISAINLTTRSITNLTLCSSKSGIEGQDFDISHTTGKMIYIGTKEETFQNKSFFIRDVFTQNDMFITNLSGGFYYSVAVSPDMKKILFIHDRGDGYNYAWKHFSAKKRAPRMVIMEMNIDGSDLHEIALDPSKLKRMP